MPLIFVHHVLSDFINIQLEKLVSSEDIPRIYFLFHVVKAGIVTVGDDGVALTFERCEVIDDAAAEERAAVLKRRLVDDNFCSLGLHSLHHALNA